MIAMPQLGWQRCFFWAEHIIRATILLGTEDFAIFGFQSLESEDQTPQLQTTSKIWQFDSANLKHNSQAARLLPHQSKFLRIHQTPVSSC